MTQAVPSQEFLIPLKQVFAAYEVHSDRIMQACDFAIMAHEGQVRKYEGIPYVTHPMSVAIDVAHKYQDADMIIAALLHDTVEDNEMIQIEDIYTKRGRDVGFMVEAVTDRPLFFIDNPSVAYADKIEKLLAGGFHDVRVLLLKIADRDHNLITLQGLKPNKQIRMTFETQAIYEPLREILLGGDETLSVQAIDERFQTYIEANQLSTPAQLKHNLYSKMYHNFDNETYQLAYNNTDTIVRQIEDKEWFYNLLDLKNFKDNIHIISLRTDGSDFKARFSFKGGIYMQDIPIGKYQVYNYSK